MRKMISIEEALALVLEHTSRSRVVEVDLSECAGMTLAEPVRADRDYPPFDRAMMDGYAVRITDAGARVEVVGEVPAGTQRDAPLEPGTCVEIMTGAPCPPGTEAVVHKEIVDRDGEHAAIPEHIKVEMHIVRKGAERRRGDEVLPAGTCLTPIGLGIAAAVGRRGLRVHARPTLAVITTGDELVTDGGAVDAARIRNSNGPMLAAMARGVGVRDIVQLHARDTVDDLAAALSQIEQVDVVLLSGGVSAGTYDLVPDALSAYGATAHFHKVVQKPGKPLLFATRDQQLLFGLPGTPLGSHLGFHRYVATAIRALQGRSPVEPPCDRGTLAAPLTVRGERVKFVLARVEPSNGGWQVTPFSGHGSSDLFALASANAYVRMPAGDHSEPAGAAIGFEWTAGLPDGGRA